MISRQQKAIIRRICQEQEESLLRLEKITDEIHQQLLDEGYEVNKLDVAAAVAENLKQWGDVKQEPEKFLRHLDESNLGLIKHHLVNDYLGVDDAKPIWKQLNLFDSVNQFRN